MTYTFELLGITPILDFFNHQQTTIINPEHPRAKYLGMHQCTLDRVLSEVSTASPEQNWDVDSLSQVIVDYWIRRANTIAYWKDRLQDAGTNCLLIARVADMPLLRYEFEHLFLR